MSAVRGLRRSRVTKLGLVAAFVGCLGCQSAHYVTRYPDRGVVAIPEDTPALRAKAEKLMHEQFPGGYVIDDIRPVAVGRPHHPQDEVMLFYHAAVPTPPGAPVVAVVPPPGPVVVPHVQPAALTAQPDALPPQPIPVNVP
jgi:hypothetical protein